MSNLKSVLVKSQKKTFIKTLTIDGERVDVTASVRYDDECGNGHNSFSITGDMYRAGKRGDRNLISCGCIHDDVKKAFPDLVPFIKWHLCSSDGPMHYVANSMYHARTSDTEGFKPGDVIAHREVLRFSDLPIEFEQSQKGFFEFLKGCKSDFSDLEIEQVEHRDSGGSGYQFDPKYTFKGFVDAWHTCPFDTKREAENFLLALRNSDPHFVKVPCNWAKAVTPDLEAAKSCAIWPEAELCDFTKEKLESRLPALLAEFKKDVESLGFTY